MSKRDPRAERNARRISSATLAVEAFAEEEFNGRSFETTAKEQPNEGDDAYCMVLDLTCNLMHLAERHGWNVETLLRRASDHYKAELTE